MVTPEDQVVLRNEEAVFHCQFTAEPPPVLEWYHEGDLLVNKTRYVRPYASSPLYKHQSCVSECAAVRYCFEPNEVEPLHEAQPRLKINCT